jgi:hypothetical protein
MLNFVLENLGEGPGLYGPSPPSLKRSNRHNLSYWVGHDLVYTRHNFITNPNDMYMVK